MQDKVLTVCDFYDGPIKGVAELQGAPHFYLRLFDESSDEDSGYYLLVPIDGDTLALAIEQQDLWIRWRRAIGHRPVGSEIPPRSSSNRLRTEEIELEINERLRTHPTKMIIARGHFEERSAGKYSVRWHSILTDGSSDYS